MVKFEKAFLNPSAQFLSPLAMIVSRHEKSHREAMPIRKFKNSHSWPSFVWSVSFSYGPNELHVIPLKSCRKDLTDYLTNLGVSGSRDFAGTRINEADVILNRVGFYLLSEEDRERITVCPKHRYELTTHYQKLKSSCSHPSHRGEA